MLLHTVKVYPSKINLPKKKQLAWKIAEIASDNAKLKKYLPDYIFMSVEDGIKETVAWFNDNYKEARK